MRRLPALPVPKSNLTLSTHSSTQKTVNRSVGLVRQFDERFNPFERAVSHSVEVFNYFETAFKCSVKAINQSVETINRSVEPFNQSVEAINQSVEAFKYNLLYFSALQAFRGNTKIKQTRYNRLQTHF